MKRLLCAGLLALLAFSACKKDKKENEPETEDAKGSWQFTTEGKTYKGAVEVAAFANIMGGQLSIAGFPASGSQDSIFNVTIQFSEGDIIPGTYKTEDAGVNFTFRKPSGDVIYAANATSAPLPDFPGQVISIQITGYDAGTKIVTGTFSGEAYGQESKVVTITNGSFKTPVQR